MKRRSGLVLGLLGAGVLFAFFAQRRTGQDDSFAAAGGRGPEGHSAGDTGGRARAGTPHLDPSLLRLASPYGVGSAASHANLSLAVRVVARPGDARAATPPGPAAPELPGSVGPRDSGLRPQAGVTVLLDDTPAGVSDNKGLLTLEVPISDSGEARHLVWAESGSARSSPFVFKESNFPNNTKTLLLKPSVSVEGLVIDAEGQPAADASVALDPPVLPPTQAGSEGRFVFKELPPGHYTLEAWKQRTAATTPLLVRSTGVTRSLLRLAPLKEPRGSVLDQDQQPVAGATVRLSDALTRKELGEQTTDDRGDFAFSPTLLRRLNLSANLKGAWAYQLIESPFSPVTLVLQRTGVVSGQVLGPDHQPRPGATVQGFPPLTYIPGANLQTTATGAEARYRLARLPLDTHTLYAAAKGQGAFQALPGLELSAGEETHFDIVLAARGEALSGEVLDSKTGQGIDHAEILIQPIKNGTLFSSNEVTLQSDAAGHFEVASIDADELWITATHPTHRKTRTTQPLKHIVIKMKPGRHLEGQVLDKAGVPIDHFEINKTSVHDEMGYFSLAVDQDLDRLQLSATGYQPKEVPLPDGTEEAAGKLGVITLEASKILKVKVVGTDGRPAPGASIYQFDERAGPGLTAALDQLGYFSTHFVATTDEAGEADLLTPEAGQCLGARWPGSGPSVDPSCPKASPGDSSLTIRLSRPAILTGQAGGPGWEIKVAPEQTKVISDAAGHYRVGSLGPGYHQVTFTGAATDAAPPVSESRLAELQTGVTTQLDLDDPGRCSASVRLTGDTDQMVIVRAYRDQPKPTTRDFSALAHAQRALEQRSILGEVHGSATVQLKGLFPGATRIEVRKNGATREAHLTLRVGHSNPVNLALP